MPEQVVHALEVLETEDGDEIDVVPTDAGPPAVGLSEADATTIAAAERLITEAICRRINARISDDAVFSEPVRDLLYRAWSMAAQFRNIDVRVEHVIAALATSEAALSNEFDAVLGDRIVPLAATMRRLAGQRATTGRPKVAALPPHKGVTIWLSEAARLSRLRNAAEVDIREDFLGVLESPGSDPAAKAYLATQIKRAREADRAETQLDRVRRDAESISQNTSRLRSNVRGDLEAAITRIEGAVASATSDVKTVSAALEGAHRAAIDQAISKLQSAFDQKTDAMQVGVGALAETVGTTLKSYRHDFKSTTDASADKQIMIIADLKQSLKSAEDTLANRHSAIAREVEDLVAELKAARTKPPRVIALIGLIVAAIGLGAGIGYAIFTLAPKLLAL
jgi:hypothetical protein